MSPTYEKSSFIPVFGRCMLVPHFFSIESIY